MCLFLFLSKSDGVSDLFKNQESYKTIIMFVEIWYWLGLLKLMVDWLLPFQCLLSEQVHMVDNFEEQHSIMNIQAAFVNSCSLYFSIVMKDKHSAKREYSAPGMWHRTLIFFFRGICPVLRQFTVVFAFKCHLFLFVRTCAIPRALYLSCGIPFTG